MQDLSKLKPNELIRLAIHDMKATIAQGHEINMSNWGKNINKEVCQVCFAGSIMLQQKQEHINGEFEVFSDCNKNSFYALDSIRKGELGAFCRYLKIDIPLIHGLNIDKFYVEYSIGEEEKFYAQMETIAKLFD